MRYNLVLLIPVLFIFFLLACESQEEIQPLQYPRFSVALIQEISENGVQLGANVYEIGSQEVIEYGFAYSKTNISPRVDFDDFVSAKGKPEEYFELFANHSMNVGDKYYVVAYLKTSELVVYSEAQEFVSQGAKGFVIESVEWPDVIYKNQSVTIKGKRLSRVISNYNVSIDRFLTSVSMPDSNTLVVDIPIQFLTETTGKEKEVELLLKLGDRTYSQRKLVKFQEPIFEKLPLQEIDYDQAVVIKGDFLDLGPVNIKFGGQEMRGIGAQRNELRFFPYRDSGFLPSISDHDVIYTVRGESYSLGKVFRTNGLKLLDDQIRLAIDSDEISARNFDFNDLEKIKFLDDQGNEVRISLSSASISGLKINTTASIYPSRNFKMQVSIGDMRSNFADFEVTNPVISLEATARDYKYNFDDRSITWGTNAYVLTRNGIYKESLDGKFTQALVSNLPVNVNNTREFVFNAVKDGFIVGGGLVNYSELNKELFFYSVERNNWEKLPDMPLGFYRFEKVSSLGDFLVFEYPWNYDEGQRNETWTLNRRTGSWEKVSDNPPLFYSDQVFYAKEETFRFGYQVSFDKRAIYKLSPQFTWEFYMDIPDWVENSNAVAPIVIGDKFYARQSYYRTLYEINLSTNQVKSISLGPYIYFGGELPVTFDNGFYLISSDIVNEVRFDLF